jgi:hypothetical protein
MPLAITLTGGNRHDITQPIPLLDAGPPIRGRPRRRPRELFADRGYDHDLYRRRRRLESGSATHHDPAHPLTSKPQTVHEVVSAAIPRPGAGGSRSVFPAAELAVTTEAEFMEQVVGWAHVRGGSGQRRRQLLRQ